MLWKSYSTKSLFKIKVCLSPCGSVLFMAPLEMTQKNLVLIRLTCTEIVKWLCFEHCQHILAERCLSAGDVLLMTY